MADHDSRSGHSYLRPEILAYVDRVHAAHDPALQAAFEAPDAEGIEPIQVGPSEGKLLHLLARLVQARKVVEVGTLTGYSALRLASGMSEGGRLWTIESEPRHAEVARARIAAAGRSDVITVEVGRALEVLPRLREHGPFDVVFVDADKENYPAYGAWARDNLRSGGLLIGDNAFLFGNLCKDGPRPEAMRRFHEEAAQAFDSVCVGTPDGILVGIKR